MIDYFYGLICLYVSTTEPDKDDSFYFLALYILQVIP